MSAVVLTAPRADASGGGGSSSQADARRDQLLDAALEVMSRKGFHETSISDIAARARVSRATLYQYFADKRAVLTAISDRLARRIIAAIDAWAPFPAPPPGTDSAALRSEIELLIGTRVAQVVSAVAADMDAARLILRLVRSYDGFVDDSLRRIDRHVVGMLIRDIETAVEFGWARPCRPEQAARFILGGIERVVLDSIDSETPLVLDVTGIADSVFFLLVHPSFLAPAAPKSGKR